MSNNNETVLRNALQRYKHPDLAKREAFHVLRQYPDLRPKLEPFIFNDGTTKDLALLDGTIPVLYKGSTYNIPLHIWLLDTHPYNPPMVFVRPTSTMQIRPGKNVDSNGKIDLPYLREWRHPNSDLYGLIQILTIVFGEEPPVFSKVPQRPSYPPGGSASTNPPYPTGGAGYNMPMPNVGAGSQQSYPQQGYPQPSGSNFPPYPASQTQTQTTGYPNYPGYNQYPNPATTASSSNPPYPNSSFPPSYSGTNPPYPAAANTGSSTSDYRENRTMTGTVTEEHIKASLLSAVSDKIRRQLKDTFEQAQFEMEALQQTQKDLQKGKEKLDGMINSLEDEKTQLDKNIQVLGEKDTEIKDRLHKLENQEKMDIDEAVVTTAPLYKQLLNSFAEEQAIDDCVYYLGEALRKNVIETDVFLKQVRELSRRQFVFRALIQKCRERAGLPVIS